MWHPAPLWLAPSWRGQTDRQSRAQSHPLCPVAEGRGISVSPELVLPTHLWGLQGEGRNTAWTCLQSWFVEHPGCLRGLLLPQSSWGRQEAGVLPRERELKSFWVPGPRGLVWLGSASHSPQGLHPRRSLVLMPASRLWLQASPTPGAERAPGRPCESQPASARHARPALGAELRVGATRPLSPLRTGWEWLRLGWDLALES